MTANPTVAIAGATGFVGQALRTALQKDYHVVALTRSVVRAKDLADDRSVDWRYCDLFSLDQVERALTGADYAVYLVHSMMPSARLDQADFEDLDVLLADNFARAAQRCNVRQVLYLGGIIPEGCELSRHLRSRLEVEQTLMVYHPAVTALRAGLIVGRGGSSFSMLINLVRRLPLMVLPAWTRSESQPIAIEDVVRACLHCLGNRTTFSKHFDIGGPEVMTYRSMLERTAGALGLRRPMLQTPVVSEEVSKGWVSMVTGASRELAAPLVESLRHRMVVADNPVQRAVSKGLIRFEDSLRASLTNGGQLAPNPRRIFRLREQRAMKRKRSVRSVQRLPLPPGRDARWVAQAYTRWLPTLVWPFFRCWVREDGSFGLALRGTRLRLLQLTRSVEHCFEGRELFHISGGWLVRRSKPECGRLEFRVGVRGKHIFVAIHDFVPMLPWPIYSWTQAQVHLWVMRRFRRHLERSETESVRSRASLHDSTK